MKSFISELNIPLVVIAIAIVVICIMGIIIYIRNSSIEGIREDVYSLFLKAEHLFTVSGAGEEKMQWVCEKAYILLPKYVQFFVTPEMIKCILQKWFVQIKDLLDDGKNNDSASEEDDANLE